MTATVTLPVAQWAPDMPSFNMSGEQSPRSMTAKNVIPRTPESYGPMPSLGGTFFSALTAACQGAYACIDSSSNVQLFAGDKNDLYLANLSGNTFTNVSASLHGYNCAANASWHMALFNNRVIATDFTDAVQSYVLGSSSAFAALSANAPKAKYCAVVKSFLVLANINDSAYGNGVQPQWVWWSANNDPTSWPQPGTSSAAAVQSSYNPLYGDGGQITGIVGNLANADGAVFMEHGVWRMVYSGGSSAFSFYPAGNVRGCQAPNSIVQVGQMVYFLAEDGFYEFDGAQANPIGVNRVDKWFLQNVNQTRMNDVVGTADPANKLIFWAFPSVVANTGSQDTVLIYNWAIDRWSYASVNIQWLMRALTFGYTLDQLYTILGYTIDNLPAPLDSPIWIGNRISLAAFDTNNKLNFVTGTPLAATVDAAEIQPTPNARSFVSMARPLIDGATPSVSIGHRNRLVDTATFDSAVVMNSDGLCPQSTDDRYIRAEITVPAGSTWSHVQGVELQVDPSSPL